MQGFCLPLLNHMIIQNVVCLFVIFTPSSTENERKHLFGLPAHTWAFEVVSTLKHVPGFPSLWWPNIPFQRWATFVSLFICWRTFGLLLAVVNSEHKCTHLTLFWFTDAIFLDPLFYYRLLSNISCLFTNFLHQYPTKVANEAFGIFNQWFS